MILCIKIFISVSGEYNKMNKSKFLKNIIFGFGGQVFILVLGIVIPRIMITSYGSDVNGFLNTISQIFSYMALLEAGIGQAARNALMEPLSKKDKQGISYISSVANRYYKRFTVYYGLCVLGGACICPFILKTEVDKLTIFIVFLFEGASGVLSFSKIQTITSVLSADGFSYITNGINVVNKIISYAAKIIMASFGVNIIMLEVVYFLITIAKVFFYQKYFRNHYSWIDLNIAPRDAKLHDRNAYVLTEIAWTIFSSTDLIVLSICVSTKISSVYGVYNLVFSSINLLLNAVYSSISYILGQTYHKDIKMYIDIHDGFTSVFFGGMTSLMCTTQIMILPFVKLYTRGIADVEYIYTSLPVMFALIQVLSWSRYITGNLSGVAGYAKITSYISVVEAVLNVLLSFILVHKFGIVGVLFATVIALPIKVIFLTWLSERKILKRNPIKYLSILFSNYVLFALSVIASKHIDLSINSYADFFIWGCVVFLCCGLISSLLNIVVNPKVIQLLKKMRRSKQNG